MKREIMAVTLALGVFAASSACAASSASTKATTSTTAKATTSTKVTPASRVSTAPRSSYHSNLGLENLGVAVGYVSPENLDGTLGLGVFADHGTFAPRFSLESRIDYWSWSDNTAGIRAKSSDVVLGARTKYHFDVTSPKFRPYAGAGLGLHFLNSRVSFPASGGNPATRVDASDAKLGLDVGGGFAAMVNPRADFLAESWYGFVSDANQFSIRAGMQFKYGR